MGLVDLCLDIIIWRQLNWDRDKLNSLGSIYVCWVFDRNTLYQQTATKYDGGAMSESVKMLYTSKVNPSEETILQQWDSHFGIEQGNVLLWWDCERISDFGAGTKNREEPALDQVERIRKNKAKLEAKVQKRNLFR